MINQKNLNQYLNTQNNQNQGATNMNQNKYNYSQWIIDGLTQKNGEEFDDFIQLLSVKCVNEILDDPEVDFLTGYKKLRMNDYIQAIYDGHYFYDPVDEYLTPKTKKEAIEHIKTYTDCRAFGKLEFDVDVEYAGVYIETVHVEIKSGREANSRKPSKKTSDLRININHKTLKGLRAAQKALKDFEKARNVELYHHKLVF